MIHFDIPKLEKDLTILEGKTIEPGFWENTDESNKVLEKIKSIKNKSTKYRNLEKELNDLKDIVELLKIEYDEDLEKEMITSLNSFGKLLGKFEIEILLSGKYYKNNAILTIHPGAWWY